MSTFNFVIAATCTAFFALIAVLFDKIRFSFVVGSKREKAQIRYLFLKKIPILCFKIHFTSYIQYLTLFPLQAH